MRSNAPTDAQLEQEPTKLILIIAAAFGLFGYILSSWVFSHGQGPKLGTNAPQQSFRTLQGDAFSLADLRGNIVVINFWASWCPPCIEEMPMLDAANQRGEIRLIAVADDTLENVETFLQRNPIRAPVVLLSDAPNILRNFETPNLLPYSVIIDRNGKLVAKHKGLMQPEKLAELLQLAAGS
jgi:thiol-disulfide isomerase/thioredoxin